MERLETRRLSTDQTFEAATNFACEDRRVYKLDLYERPPAEALRRSIGWGEHSGESHQAKAGSLPHHQGFRTPPMTRQGRSVTRGASPSWRGTPPGFRSSATRRYRRWQICVTSRGATPVPRPQFRDAPPGVTAQCKGLTLHSIETIQILK